MLPRDLIITARKLVPNGKGKPRQSHLRRAESTAYYAVFHCLARACADYLVGTNSKTRSKHAWRRVYRSLSHGPSKNACEHKVMSAFPTEIQDFANTFKELQEKRHEADYNPYCKLTRSEVITDINRAEAAIKDFNNTPLKDRKAFCTLAIFFKGKNV